MVSSPARPIAAPRRLGQILSSAVGVLIAERRRFFPVTALVLAGGIVASILRLLLLKIPAIRDADLLLAGHALSRAVFALVAGLAVTIPVAIVAVALATAVASDLDPLDSPAGGGGGFSGCWSGRFPLQRYSVRSSATSC